MPRFFRRLSEGVLDLEDVRARAKELTEFVSAASLRYQFDTHYGGRGSRTAPTSPRPCSCFIHRCSRSAILLSPMLPLEPDAEPDLHGARVFVGAGRFDTITPPDQAEKLVRRLRAAGADVVLAGRAVATPSMPRSLLRPRSG